MNAPHTDTVAPPKQGGQIHKPSKRLIGWGLPIGVGDLDGLQRMHDTRRNLDFLHKCFEMAPWYNGKADAPKTADGNEGHALYCYNLPCGAQLAVWVPKMNDSDGKLAVYMTGYVGKQDVAGNEGAHVLVEVRQSMGG